MLSLINETFPFTLTFINSFLFSVTLDLFFFSMYLVSYVLYGKV